MLLPLQGASIGAVVGTQGAASLALGYVLLWAFIDIIGCGSAIQASLIAFALHDDSARLSSTSWRQSISISIHQHIKPILLGVSPYVLSATRTSVRGRPPRSGLMSLCSYVLMFPALAAAKPRYGVSPYVSYSMGRSPHTKVMFLM